MSERFGFDLAFLGELIGRWQEYRGFYSLNTRADQVGNLHETGARCRLSGPHVPLTRFPGWE